MKAVLSDRGMGIAFDPDRATFDEMTDVRPVWIGRVLHKTFLEVNEEGTEAAAATDVVGAMKAIPFLAEPFKMIVDRPFFLAIVDSETGVVLFLGAITDPR